MSAEPRAHPEIDDDAWVAPDATVSGDVSIASGARIMDGARLIAAAGGSIRIGRETIVMENAVVRSIAGKPCVIGDNCIVGPNAHVASAHLEEQVFVATGATIFHGAVVGRGAEVRVHGVVHLRTRLAPGAVVPIGWVAVGEPARILPPDAHDEIWEIQKSLDFPGFVYGVERDAPDVMVEITRKLSKAVWSRRRR